MRPSDRIAQLESEVRALHTLNRSLKSQLKAQGIETFDLAPAWAEGLRPGEICLMSSLLTGWPKAVSSWVLEENLPKMDHAKERDMNIIKVRIHGLRKRFGKTAIETVRGLGYRVSDECFHRVNVQPVLTLVA